MMTLMERRRSTEKRRYYRRRCRTNSAALRGRQQRQLEKSTCCAQDGGCVNRIRTAGNIQRSVVKTVDAMAADRTVHLRMHLQLSEAPLTNGASTSVIRQPASASALRDGSVCGPPADATTDDVAAIAVGVYGETEDYITSSLKTAS